MTGFVDLARRTGRYAALAVRLAIGSRFCGLTAQWRYRALVALTLEVSDGAGHAALLAAALSGWVGK